MDNATAQYIEGEEWRWVENREKWQVSSEGRMRKLYGDEWFLFPDYQPVDYYGYRAMSMPEKSALYRANKKPILVHRIVATAFIGPPPSDTHQVNHKNGKKRDNRLVNLEWVTPSENVQHAWDTGLHSDRLGKGLKPLRNRWEHSEDLEWEMPLNPD